MRYMPNASRSRCAMAAAVTHDGLRRSGSHPNLFKGRNNRGIELSLVLIMVVVMNVWIEKSIFNLLHRRSSPELPGECTAGRATSACAFSAGASVWLVPRSARVTAISSGIRPLRSRKGRWGLPPPSQLPVPHRRNR